MDRIKLGEYVRFKDGEIGKIIDIKEDPPRVVYSEYGEIGLVADIVKHSQNIFDLIKIGDFVNGYEILDIYVSKDNWEPIEIKIDSKGYKFLFKENIKTILTKEKYERECYTVE